MGLDFSGFGTQAAFFDYDIDGDLDFFLMNHSLRFNGTFNERSSYENTFDTLSSTANNAGAFLSSLSLQQKNIRHSNIMAIACMYQALVSRLLSGLFSLCCDALFIVL